MRRLLAWSITLLLIAAGLLWPLLFDGGGSGGGTVDDPMVIRDYRADFVVADDGELTAVETITGEFPADRHGIFRYWDVVNPNSPRIRQRPVVESVTRDGAPEPYEMLWESGERFRVAKIGSAEVTLNPGDHVFEMRYRIPGVLDPGTPAPTAASPPPPGTRTRRRRSSGTSSHRRGTTGSTARRSA